MTNTAAYVVGCSEVKVHQGLLQRASDAMELLRTTQDYLVGVVGPVASSLSEKPTESTCLLEKLETCMDIIVSLAGSVEELSARLRNRL